MNLLDSYRYLAALDQHRHFGRASAACHITQPALSNALRALEAHLGVAIVRRGRQYGGLTPEGEQVLASAHRMLREQALLQEALASAADMPRGRLVIGAVPTVVVQSPPLCSGFRSSQNGARMPSGSPTVGMATFANAVAGSPSNRANPFAEIWSDETPAS